MPYKTDQAEIIAINALNWLAGKDDLLLMFLSSTGADINDLRTRAQNPEFLASVLDFLLMDDAFVTGFCQAANLPFEAPMQARMALPGGEMPNWT